jgi:hypothetical protein
VLDGSLVSHGSPVVRRVPNGSRDSLGDSLVGLVDSLTACSPIALAGSFDACQIVRSLRSADLSTRARWLARVAR